MLYSCLIYFFTIAICVRATQQIRTARYRRVLAKRNNNCIKFQTKNCRNDIIHSNQMFHHHISGCATAYLRLCHSPIDFQKLLVVKISWRKKSKKKSSVLTNFYFLVNFIRHTGHMDTMVTRCTGNLSQVQLV